MRIVVHKEANPEDNAMLQALYSRSPKSVVEHVQKLQGTGSGKFMEQFYIGYGHASVGDLGETTVYFEGISMLAAKAIEDNQLFNGQECSSRYIDFSTQPFLSEEYGIFSEGVDNLLNRMRAFYVHALPVVEADLAAKHPQQEGQSDVAYHKAIKARAFDILRGFLPCGATTNVAWSGTLRNMRERLELLMHHPLDEVKKMAANAYAQLYTHYPHSFVLAYANIYADGCDASEYEKALTEIEGEEVYEHLSSLDHFYSDVLAKGLVDEDVEIVLPPPLAITGSGLNYWNRDLVTSYSRHPRKYRPTKHGGSEWVRVEVQGVLDFGSFRDLQRHRGGYCSMPVVDHYEGLHYWYYYNLPESLHAVADGLLDSIRELDLLIMNDAVDPMLQRVHNQYFMPMGLLVPFSLNYSVSQAIYVAELRSGQTVHPTLRIVAQDMASYLESLGVVLYWDDSASTWSIRRGTQDIVEKT